MKVNILDAGLKMRGGRDFDYCRKLAQALAAAGHDLHIYGFAGLDDDAADALRPFGEITRRFTRYHYEPSARVDHFAGDLALFYAHAEALQRELATVRDADLWVWPSLRPQQLYACAKIKLKTPLVGCVHEDPGIAERSIDAMLWRVAFLDAHRAGMSYSVGAHESDIRHEFMTIVPDGKFARFPHPVDGPPLKKPKSKLERIGFFGFQRAEKGTPIMGHLLSKLLDEGYEIVFHDSNGENKRLQHPKIETLSYVDDISGPIARCDLVVLPYQPSYRAKGSGILAACLAVGVPVIGPYATIPGRLIEQYGVGALFANLAPESVYAAIKTAEGRFATYAGNAHRFAPKYGERNGVARYAERVLALA